MKRVAALFMFTMVIVLSGSWFAAGLWGGKSEKLEIPSHLEWDSNDTIASFAEKNRISAAVLKESLGQDVLTGQEATMGSLGLDASTIEARIRKAAALEAEHAGKNWKKILPKLLLWVVFLGFVFRNITSGKLNRKTRLWHALFAVALFGVAFGSDPSPMGTVKDAIVLFATSGGIFPPRIIALIGFLATVVFANKAICAWGCQLGTLQESLFRMNRNATDTGARTKQFKIPFGISNGIRVAMLLIFITIVALTGIDAIEPIDPFKVFNPSHLGIAGAIFAITMLALSLFVYRPWCHLVCPFGLVGWVLERWSFNRIRVRRSTCTSCGACARACPSHAMEGILHQRAVVPDCFSCGVCMEICPTHSVIFGRKGCIDNAVSEKQ